MFISLFVGLMLGAAAVVFSLQNITTVSVAFMDWQFESSLAVILILALGTGALISWLFWLPTFIKKSLLVSSYRKEVNSLKERLAGKAVEVDQEKNKMAANNAYLDDMEKNHKI
ncbi:MAG: LapA family protein [Candidatus Colwellbacteria bacterium]|nr:LapA family protein [Candidatus Colwellbacteria bacterium]